MSEKPCLKCGGTGTRIVRDEFDQAVLPCKVCGGSGKMQKEKEEKKSEER